MRQKILMNLLSGFAVVAIMFAFLWPDSVLKPQVAIQSDLLQETPLGSTTEDVTVAISNHGWKNLKQESTAAFFKQNDRQSNSVLSATSSREQLDSLNPTSLIGFWHFDDIGKLTDIKVWQITDERRSR